jgi:hypothetical protein
MSVTMRSGMAGVVFWSVLAAMSAASPVDDRPPLIPRPAPVTVVKPGQMALSPDGDRVAIADRFGNRINVVNSRGEMIWSVGEGVTLEQPTAVMFASSGELIFSQWESSRLFRVAEKAPTQIDTLIDFSTVIGPRARIIKLYGLRNRSILTLTTKPDGLVRFDADWKKSTVLIKAGSGKGQLNYPVACAELMSGRIAVAQSGAYPVQVFDSKGGLLFAVDWNSPSPRNDWDAAADAVDQRETIWVADASLAQFRQYDPTGTLLSVRLFASPNRFPADMVITGDNQLMVIDENGRLDLYDLSQEN